MDYTSAVDLTGLMKVLGEHLYSTPQVAIREVVQNAHDSIVRRRALGGEPFEASIVIRTDLRRRTMQISDTGAGLRRDEILAFLATIGAGQTRQVRESTGSDELIGQFGLGFLSAFSVATEVVVESTAASSPNERWRYRSNDGISFRLEPVEFDGRSVGSTVSLTIAPEHGALLESEYLWDLLRRYCALLQEPILVEIEGELRKVNVTPPWRDASFDLLAPEDRRARAIEFASSFDTGVEPLCCIEVVPFGNSDARGLLWVQGGSSYGTSDNRRLAVFVRGMLLDENARDLLPTWAGFVSGVIESRTLVPTASREDLQRTQAYDAIQAAISETLVLGLGSLARSQPAAWRRVLARHNEALLGASLVDQRLFDSIASDLTVPTSQGDLPVEQLVVSGAIRLGSAFSTGFSEVLFRALKQPVATADRYAVAPFVRRWAEHRDVALIELGTDDGNAAMFAPTPVSEADVRLLRTLLADDDDELRVVRFAPSELPLVSVVDREAELKRRLDDDDADRRIARMALQLARIYTDRIGERPPRTLYVNLANPAIAALLAAAIAGNGRAHDAARLLRATKVLLDTRSDGDLSAALDAVNAAVERLLEG